MLTMHDPRADERALVLARSRTSSAREFPEWTCSRVQRLLRRSCSTRRTPARRRTRPTRTSRSTRTPNTMTKYPVGVNLAYGDTGLFTQCVNGTTGCDGTPGDDHDVHRHRRPRRHRLRRSRRRARATANSLDGRRDRLADDDRQRRPRRDHHAAHRDLGHQRSHARLARAGRRVHVVRRRLRRPAR